MSDSISNPVTAAIIQAQPVYYDRAACLTKALDLIHQAVHQGAQLITFGETWFPGYPAWLDNCRDIALWDHAPTKAVFERLYHNSLEIGGAELQKLQTAARQLNTVLVISFNETGLGGTIYNSLVTIDVTGEIVNHHRKLMPTYTERMVWGMGDGAGLQAVSTGIGRIGGLICWEHWMPLARQAMHASVEQIHIAVFPTVHERHQIASRHYAFEGRTFVLTAGSILPASAMPETLERAVDLAPDTLVQRGGSAIIAPDGSYLVEPVFDVEQTLIATLDLTQIIRESMTLDVTGHYSRPDVFDFAVNRQRKS